MATLSSGNKYKDVCVVDYFVNDKKILYGQKEDTVVIAS
jgi:hypothetical protein